MKQVKELGAFTLHSRAKLINYLWLDVFATLLSAAFVWFCSWFYYEDFRPPDMSGIPHSIPQLQQEISHMSAWCMGMALIAAIANFVIVRQMIRAKNLDARKTNKIAVLSALLHWLIIFSPSLLPA